jgi:hypothetical protein
LATYTYAATVEPELVVPGLLGLLGFPRFWEPLVVPQPVRRRGSRGVMQDRSRNRSDRTDDLLSGRNTKAASCLDSMEAPGRKILARARNSQIALLEDQK